ncbi:MAG: hypothetical protein NT027_07795, partial [Proteobacteria bacterium]|nr:hypothetical protein [Pseudomonadota bacterium]
MRRFLNQLNPSSLSYHTSKKVTISLFLMLTSCSESDFSGKAAQGKKPSSSNIESKDPPAETPISTPTDAPTKKLDSDGNDLERYPELNAPFSTSDGSKVIIEGKEYIATNAIAVVFEDSPSRGHTAWNSRDIKVCVKGQFAFDATSRIIRSISKKGIEIDVEAYRKPASSLRHKFLLEIHDQGQKIREEGFDTE